MSPRAIAVAIDGPAGAGKSTVSRQVAERLGYVLLDTGALYRSVAWAARQRGVAWEDEAAVGAVARELTQAGGIEFERIPGGVERVLVGGRDVTLEIRTPEMGQGASQVSALPAVRAALLELQRRAASRGGVVLEGRDIGTVVLPDAEAKFYLTASVEVRAERRYRELVERGEAVSLDAIRKDVEARDQRDMNREVAPLVKAPDAVGIDSSHLSTDEVVDRIVAHVDGLRSGDR